MDQKALELFLLRWRSSQEQSLPGSICVELSAALAQYINTGGK